MEVSSLSAFEAAEDQKSLFKGTGKFQLYPEAKLLNAMETPKTSAYDQMGSSAVSRLPGIHERPLTAVKEAALSVLESGVLNIPDIGRINVQQVRSFVVECRLASGMF